MNFVTNFSSAKDVISFLNVSKKTLNIETPTSTLLGAFDDYEVIYISIESSLGTKFSIETETIDVSGSLTYVKWGNIKNSANYFVNDASPNTESIFLNIRLRAPNRLYASLNSNKLGEYLAFDINFHIDKDLYMVSTSSVEKRIPVIYPEISANWDKLIENYIYLWSKSK